MLAEHVLPLSMMCFACGSPTAEAPHPSNVASAQGEHISVELDVSKRRSRSTDCAPRGAPLVVGRDEIVARLVQREFPEQRPDKIASIDLSDFRNLGTVAGGTFLALDLHAEEGLAVAKVPYALDVFCIDVDRSHGPTRIVIDLYMQVVE